MSQQEDPRTRFYKIYRKEAEEYDKEFMKKYDKDLSTTLIFVSLARCPDTRALSWATGRSVLRRGFRIHHRGPFGVPAKPERRDERSDPCHDLHHEQHRLRR